MDNVGQEEAAVTVAEVPYGTGAGTRLGGRFRLDDRIGGSHGTSVWKATDELLARPVAIHVLPDGPVPGDLIAAVNAAAKVTDPRLVKIFDADYGAEAPYVVSEWAPGERLEELLLAGPPSPALAAAIIGDAADALAVAHDAGRPHLRLSPRSLRWGEHGVKITGLGIKAALSHAGSDDAAAADTMALGRMLYALLTGYWPGEEATALPPAPWHRGCLCTPRQVRAGVPAVLSAIACRALQAPRCHAGPAVASPADLAGALRATQRSWPGPLPAARPTSSGRLHPPARQDTLRDPARGRPPGPAGGRRAALKAEAAARRSAAEPVRTGDVGGADRAFRPCLCGTRRQSLKAT
jgi:hypothetical protein